MLTEEIKGPTYRSPNNLFSRIFILCTGVGVINGFARYYTPLCFLGADVLAMPLIALARYSKAP